MKDFLNNKIKITAVAVTVLAIAVTAYMLNSFYGNPFSRANAEKNIKRYIFDTYGVTDFVLTDTEYIAESGEYAATVTFKGSSDIVFDVAYSVSKNKIRDSYEDTVASGYNTFVRISSEYGGRVMAVLHTHYMTETILCYGELGKNQEFSDFKEVLSPDMEFDMYNLPLDATVSVFFDRTDTSALQFAKDLTELQKVMYANEVAVDYYDIMYNSSILLEDFPSEIVVEYLEDIDALAQYIKDYMK